MITYTTYSEAGGVGKTTTAANLAVAHARNGHDVLCIDLDPQEGSLSYLFDVDGERSDGTADNIVRHLIGRPKGDFRDLIRETEEEGVDVIPSHNMLENLTRNLMKAAEIEEDMHPDDDFEWPKHEQLLRVLKENGVPGDYDVIICDPQATPGDALNNAIFATRSVLLPVELSGKGALSIRGLDDLVSGLEGEVGIQVGVLGVVPVGFKRTNTQQSRLEELESSEFDMPVVFKERASLMQNMWDYQTSAYGVLEDKREPNGEYELETLEKYDDLAAEIEGEFE
ncbi:ParA family protein [Halostella sp. JP-L12]|uniref:ParA family protein n=1 Tax=Halostella TaxID=1843185 RepID=UPI000EF79D02|nr:MULTISPECIES: ParA family protein [Halostella]NHN49468.1 ParA family protein [Halostella sp. JP-L12]